MWRIRVVRGAGTPSALRVRDGITLGRAPESDLVLRDPLVSRVHARFTVADDGVWVTDLGSANGTEVDGVRAERARLEPGSRLRLGDCELVFESDEGGETLLSDGPVRRRAELLSTTVRIEGVFVPPAGAGPAVSPELIAQMASQDDALTRFQRFARGAARYADADRACVLVRVVPGGPHVVAGRYPVVAGDDPPRIPRAALVRVARQGEALLLASESAGVPEESHTSIRVRSSGSAMCAPIGPPGDLDAVLHVERDAPDRPFNVHDLGPFTALAAQAAASLAQELAWFRWRVCEGLVPSADDGPALVGESAAFLAALDVAERVASAQTPVLVHGERGSGRRTLARFLHARGRGDDHPWICASSTALPQGDEAAALFGEVTGARRRPGLFDDAGAGTLCLAGVALLPPSVQPLLAEALTTNRYLPVGAAEKRPVRCRLVATTSKNLHHLAATGEFHAPLAVALSGVTVGVPSLAERGDDVLLVADHFAALHGRRFRGAPSKLHANARSVIRLRTWRGNVAELSNAIERAAISAGGPEIEADDLAAAPPRISASGAPDLSLAAAERAAIVRALEAARGRRGRAAEVLGISWPTLTRKIREYGIE